MKRILPLLIVGAIGYGAYEFSKTGAAISELQYDLVGLRFKGVKGGMINLEVDYRFTNSIDKSLSIEFLSVDISLPTGGKIASVNSSKNIVLTARSTSVVTFPITSSIATLLLDVPELAQMIAQNQLPKTLKLAGYITINGIQYPINTDYALTIATA